MQLLTTTTQTLTTTAQTLAAHGHVQLLRLRDERGQGTVEYVGLILLVALLMGGMVAAVKGFQGTQGLELAELITKKIKDAVQKVTFK